MNKYKNIFNNSILIIILPGLFYYLFKIFGPFTVDPGLFFSGLVNDEAVKLTKGWPTIEPNVATSSLVGGYLSFSQIIDFKIPYWNYFSGFGTHLLADYQSAVFFPFSWLFYFGNSGQLLFHFILPIFGSLSLYFFLKKLNLSNSAALLGGLLFQFNSIFIWLQNAIFNPITFFPCILLAIEILYEEVSNKNYSFFSKGNLLGIVSASLAVLSGFPEIVFLYSFALLGWIIYRVVCLKNLNKNFYFIIKIFMFCSIALLLTLPVIYSFFDFLFNEATQERFYGPGYSNHHRNLITSISYLFPYFFGPIFGYPHPEISRMWGGIGGYVGLTIFFFSTFYIVYLPNIKKTILYFFAITLILIQFGFPILSQLFYAIPFMKLVAASRYLNIIWITIFICLASSFISCLSLKKDNHFREIFISAKKFLIFFVLVLFLIISIILATFYQDIIRYFEILISSKIYLWSLFSVLGPFIVLLLCIFFIFKKNFLLVKILIFSESFLLAFVPLFSYPIDAKYDLRIVNFLKNNINYNRFVATPGEASPITVNYGGLFGISQLNYNHSPAPKKTYKFIRDYVDKYTSPKRYLPDFPPKHLHSVDRKLSFLNNKSKFGDLGVKYIIQSKKNSNRITLNPFTPNFEMDSLKNNNEIFYVYENLNKNIDLNIDKIDLFIGSSEKKGKLFVEFCNHNKNCSNGVLDLKNLNNKKFNEIKFNKKIYIKKKFSLKLTYKNKKKNHDLLIFKNKFQNTNKILPALKIGFFDNSKVAFETERHEILLIDKYKDYFTAENCILEFFSRDQLKTSCSKDSSLIRRELFNKHWKVKVNGKNKKIVETGIFQEVKIPSGISNINFFFKNQTIENLMKISLFTLFLLIIIIFNKVVIRNYFKKN